MRKLKKYTPTKFKADTSYYDKDAADYAVAFIESLCHTKGTWAGKPFELIDWQEQIIRDLFGTLKPNGYRQFNTAYIEIPKKQGKSELAAAVALLLCCGDGEERAEVYGCAADRQQAAIVFDVAADMVRIDECTFIADKGYDVKVVYNLIKDVYHGECVIPLNKRNTKNPEKLPSGHPICEAGLAMHKDGKFTDKNRTRQKYCCPFKRSKSGCCPCNHKNWNNGKKTRGCTKYVTLPDDYRLSIDRECISFKKIYALRTESERYNSRFKSTGQERLWIHGINAARNLNTIAHIVLLATAVAAVVTKSECSYRSLKSVKRIA